MYTTLSKLSTEKTLPEPPVESKLSELKSDMSETHHGDVCFDITQKGTSHFYKI